MVTLLLTWLLELTCAKDVGCLSRIVYFFFSSTGVMVILLLMWLLELTWDVYKRQVLYFPFIFSSSSLCLLFLHSLPLISLSPSNSSYSFFFFFLFISWLIFSPLLHPLPSPSQQEYVSISLVFKNLFHWFKRTIRVTLENQFYNLKTQVALSLMAV